MPKTPFEIIAACTDPKQLRTIMENAKKQGRDDVWNAAFQRICELAGVNFSVELERDFHQTLCAYEELLSEKNDKKTSASYTRRKLNNKGVVQCLEDWAVDTKETDGFRLLVARGMPELTGEYIVLKYPKHFSPRALANARAKLEKHGVAAP